MLGIQSRFLTTNPLQRALSSVGRNATQSSRLAQLQCAHRHSKVVIVGGGTGGMNVASHLIKEGLAFPREITVIDPSSKHWYQPGFTMVGGGIFGENDSWINEIEGTLLHRPMQQMFNDNVNLVSEAVGEFEPDSNRVFTKSGARFDYDCLVVATGIETRFDLTPGLKQAMEDPDHPAGSIYHFPYAKKINRFRASFEGGKVVGTQAQNPIKCGGAPQKWVYLAEDSFRQRGLRNPGGNHYADVNYHTALPVMFAVKKYGDSLYRIALEKEINVHFESVLSRVDPSTQKAYFTQSDGTETVENYDLLHACPVHKPNAATAAAPFADATGFVDVNKHSLQSVKYDNIFAVGDCANMPAPKTSAAIIAQTPILVYNMQRFMKGDEPMELHDGYSSCPILVGGNKLMLCEFVYDNVVSETFPVDQSVPRKAFFYMKRYLFPYVYWHRMPRAQWFGRSAFLKPDYDRTADKLKKSKPNWN